MNATETQPVSSTRRRTPKLALLVAVLATAGLSGLSARADDPLRPGEMRVPDFGAPAGPRTVTLPPPLAPVIPKPAAPAVVRLPAAPRPATGAPVHPGRAVDDPITVLWGENRSAYLLKRVEQGAKVIVFYTSKDPETGWVTYRQVLGYESKGSGPKGGPILHVNLGPEYLKNVGPWNKADKPPLPIR